jgi:2OG-Fe(II) oxygenase superfamily
VASKTETTMAELECRADVESPVLSIDFSTLEGADVQALHERYRSAKPFPHIALDDVFPSDLLHAIVKEIEAIRVEPNRDFYATHRKRSISDLGRLPPVTARLVMDLNSAPFLSFLEKVTGIESLIPDPYLEGGGIHQIGAGGFLKVHTDFNFNRKLDLHRRVNLLLYLNPDWQPEWGGALELWGKEMMSAGASYLPIFNRMVIFSTTDESYHGHPEPLACPAEVTRNSIALYYYTAAPSEVAMHFRKSTMTNYQLRPAEKFPSGKLHYVINQLEIRVPIFRSMMRLLRRML